MKQLPNSPLRLPNGKRRYAKDIVDLFPRDIKEIRDVMCGSGNISFEARRQFPEARIWMNDINSDLVNFFKHSSYSNEWMINTIKSWHSLYEEKELFDYCKSVIKEEKVKPYDNNYKKMAVAFYIINRLAFSGTLDGGFTQYNYRYRLTNSNLKRLKTLDGFLAPNTLLTSVTYDNVAQAPSRKQDDEVLLFFNPPYYNDAMQMYRKSKSNGNLFDYEELSVVASQTPYKFLIAIDDSWYIRDLFGFANIVSHSTLKGKNDEKNNVVVPKDILFITNY